MGYYLFTRRSGKLIKRYIRKSDVERVRAIVDARVAGRRERRRRRAEGKRSVRDLIARLREIESEIRKLNEIRKPNGREYE